MTPDQAKIILLDNALQQAQNTVEFLHECLTHPEHAQYAYPDQTLRHLDEWGKLAPRWKYCIHSIHRSDCESCQAHIAHMTQLYEAKEVLGEHEG